MNKIKIVDIYVYDILDYFSFWKNFSGVEKYRWFSDMSFICVINVCYLVFYVLFMKCFWGNCILYLKCFERDYVGNKVLYGDEYFYFYFFLKSVIFNWRWRIIFLWGIRSNIVIYIVIWFSVIGFISIVVLV